jgi:hypothetical protein
MNVSSAKRNETVEKITNQRKVVMRWNSMIMMWRGRWYHQGIYAEGPTPRSSLWVWKVQRTQTHRNPASGNSFCVFTSLQCRYDSSESIVVHPEKWSLKCRNLWTFRNITLLMIIVRQSSVGFWNMDFIECYMLSLWRDFQIEIEDMNHKNWWITLSG